MDMHPALPWKALLAGGLNGGPDAAAALRAVPKTDLHAHCLLSMPLEAVDALGSSPVLRPPERFDGFAGFTAYVRGEIIPRIRDLDAVCALTRATFERMIAEGVAYAETSIDLLVPKYIGVTMREYAAALLAETGRVSDRLVVCLEGGLNREWPVDELEAALDAALEHEGFLGSIDLYGDERAAPARAFRGLYERAAGQGLKLKAHAGELCDAGTVREAVEVLGLQAVQHGVRAADDPSVVAFLVERGTVLNICPTSNVKLAVASSLARHPLPRLLEAGVKVTVNSDDFTAFCAGVTDELLVLHRGMGLDAAAVARIIENGWNEAPAGVRDRLGPAGGGAPEPRATLPPGAVVGQP